MASGDQGQRVGGQYWGQMGSLCKGCPLESLEEEGLKAQQNCGFIVT